MAFDQAGEQGRAGEIDHLGVGGVDGRGGSGGLDAAAAHAHRPAFVHGFAIEDAGGFEHDGVLRGGSKREEEEEAETHSTAVSDDCAEERCDTHASCDVETSFRLWQRPWRQPRWRRDPPRKGKRDD